MTLEPEATDPQEEKAGAQGIQPPPEETGEPPEFTVAGDAQPGDPYDREEAEEFEDFEPQEARPPALTINIQTWATPIVGVLMLMIGLLGGFFARPLIAPEPTPTAQAPVAAQPPTSAAQSQQSQEQQQQSQASSEDRAALMEALLPRVRHFNGNPDAPITLIEFSDFQ